MRQKFGGCRSTLDIRNVPTAFDTVSFDSALHYPLLGHQEDEFVIEPFALEECRGGGGGGGGSRSSTSSDTALRMRPYSERIVAAAATTTVTATTTPPVSCCSARPLAIGVVFVSMSFALIYFLMIVPMTSVEPPAEPSITTTVPTTVSTVSYESTTVDPLYQHLDDKHHRHQIPLIHIPLLYEVRLKLFLPWRSNVTFGADNFAVEGHVRVHFTSGGGSRILLHSDSEQHIGECVVRDEFGREIAVKHVGRGFTQVLDLHLAADMIHGMNYTLDLAFREYISQTKPQGLFAAPYPSGNDTKYVVATQLQLSDARTVFPCIDVPEVKAHFDTVIVHPTGTTAVANMMENTTRVDGNWTTTTFKRTPPMSTYLFAFFVSDYPYIEVTTSKGVRSRVYCDPAKLEAAELVTETVGPLLAFYENYFGLPYPLEKLGKLI
uniref:Aminopeptidase N-like N-terminal domain-containing protein n=1 Tax=Caenorhabditis japonica TaxID=281687 RepID=A0A8R1DP43_CAEJA